MAQPLKAKAGTRHNADETFIPVLGGGIDDVAHTLRGSGFDASEDGTGRGTPLVPVAIHPHVVGRSPEAGPQGKEYLEDGSAYTQDSRGVPQMVAMTVPLDLRNGGRDPEKHDEQNRQGVGIGEDGDPAGTVSAAFQPGVIQSVALRGRDGGATAELGGDQAGTLRAGGGGGGGGAHKAHVLARMAVRSLTPRECERLQGFPDDYTLIPGSTKAKRLGVMQPPSPDGPRYKALGNSMAVPCMEWIGERIQMVEEMLKSS